VELPRRLRDSLSDVLADASGPGVAGAVERLIERYRSGGPATEPILGNRLDVLAYAAYRLPATYAAARAALGQLRRAVPDRHPTRLLDVGGGSGAAAWAAVDAYPELTSVTVLDQVEGALTLGRRLAAGAGVMGAAAWSPWSLADALPAADLVTISYVLGELAEEDQAALLAAVAPVAAVAVVVVEPGTPAGYARVLRARDALLGAGLAVAAPCPHAGPCPIGGGRDWCHFPARVNRSATHRRVKGGELSYEDEKFSYVAAVRAPAGAAPAARVIRHPTQRKGMVQFQVCTVDGRAAPEIVSKRQGERYRAARDTGWGDPLPV
jgi:ribosomal protein RSM22 (predicted rRNA methylase)